MSNALDNLVADVDGLVSEMGSNLPPDETSRRWYASISAQFLSFNRRLRDAIKEERASRQEMEKPMKANDKAMREALKTAKKAICHYAEHVCQSLSWENSDIQSNCGDVLCAHRDLCKAKTAINAALSTPPRACDVMSQEDLTKVSTDGFMKVLETHPEFNASGIKTLAAAAISAAIKCAYDTQLASETEGATDGSK